MPSDHALLSPSAAHRWLHCTAAPRLEAALPDPGSPYAAEGTLAHSIAELKLRKALIEPMGPKKFANALKKLQADESYDPEMLGHADAYLDYIQGIVHGYPQKPYVAAEVRLDLSDFAPECFGTADCIIIGGDEMHVVDYKYGKGVQVDASDNPQLRLYALGALMAYHLFYDIRTVHMHIFQPRLGHEDTAVATRDELMDWGVMAVRPKAQTAAEGPGEYRAGDWCRFCRARGQCKEQARQELLIYNRLHRDPALLDGPGYANILPELAALRKWADQVEETALSRLLDGEEIPGYKAVEGRRTRQFIDQEAAFTALQGAGYDEALLYERKPLTLAAAEKVVGKTQFQALVGAYIISPPGKPTIAPASDKRQPISNKPSAADDFGGI